MQLFLKILLRIACKLRHKLCPILWNGDHVYRAMQACEPIHATMCQSLHVQAYFFLCGSDIDQPDVGNRRPDASARLFCEHLPEDLADNLSSGIEQLVCRFSHRYLSTMKINFSQIGPRSLVLISHSELQTHEHALHDLPKLQLLSY